MELELTRVKHFKVINSKYWLLALPANVRLELTKLLPSLALHANKRLASKNVLAYFASPIQHKWHINASQHNNCFAECHYFKCQVISLLSWMTLCWISLCWVSRGRFLHTNTAFVSLTSLDFFVNIFLLISHHLHIR